MNTYQKSTLIAKNTFGTVHLLNISIFGIDMISSFPFDEAEPFKCDIFDAETVSEIVSEFSLFPDSTFCIDSKIGKVALSGAINMPSGIKLLGIPNENTTLDEIVAFFNKLKNNDRDCELITLMRERAELIASICEFGIRFHTDKELPACAKETSSNRQSDLALFSAALLCSFFLASKIATPKRATVSFLIKNESPLFAIAFPVDKDKFNKKMISRTNELSFLSEAFEQNNLPFVHKFSKGILKMMFSPFTKEWSYYGIKLPDIIFDDRDESFFADPLA